MDEPTIAPTEAPVAPPPAGPPDLTGVHVVVIQKGYQLSIPLVRRAATLCGAIGDEIQVIRAPAAKRLPLEQRRKLCAVCAARLS